MVVDVRMDAAKTSAKTVVVGVFVRMDATKDSAETVVGAVFVRMDAAKTYAKSVVAVRFAIIIVKYENVSSVWTRLAKNMQQV